VLKEKGIAMNPQGMGKMGRECTKEHPENCSDEEV